MSKDLSGTAFPRMPGESPGLSLRDYFAVKASDADVERIMLESYDPVLEGYQATRQQARYIHADYMLKVRAE
jgi:hypothetical protein